MPLRDPQVLKVLKGADAITTYSALVLRTLHELGFVNKSHLVPNFVNVNSFARPASKTEGPGNRAIIVSRLDTFKDPMTAIRAFGIVHENVPDASLQVIGWGHLFNDLKRLAGDLNLSNAVEFLGKRADVQEFLWNNGIFIATRSGYIATIEAWAAGLAVVAPRIGIFNEIVSDGENGILVAPSNAGELGCALIRLMKDRDLRDYLAKRGKETAEQYDISRVASKMAGIYDSLVKK
jgi:glycosyltransferase involved in cell wall biosynthesis